MNKVLALVWVLLMLVVASAAQAKVLPVKTQDGVVYVADTSSDILKRYDLAAELFLADVSLTQAPTAMHVDSSGLYLAYGSSIVRRNLDGSNETDFWEASQEVRGLYATNMMLLLTGRLYLVSINKSTQLLVDEFDTHSFYSAKLIMDEDGETIYVPASNEFIILNIDEAGTFLQIGRTSGSLFDTEEMYLVPGSKHIIDGRGSIYTTRDLKKVITRNDFTNEDVAFWQGLPIVLRDDALYSYSKAFEQTGSFDLVSPVRFTDTFLMERYDGGDPVSLNVEVGFLEQQRCILSLNSVAAGDSCSQSAVGSVEESDSFVHVSNVQGLYGRVTMYSHGTWYYWLDEYQQGLKREIVVYGDKVFVFSWIPGEVERVEIVDVADLEPDDPNLEIDANNLNFDVDNFVVDNSEEFIYVLNNTYTSVFVWSIEENRFVDTISLDGPQTEFTYSAAHQRLYMSAVDGSLSYIELSDSSIHYTVWDEPLNALVAAGDYLVAKSKDDYDQYIIDKDGIQLDSAIAYEPTYDMVWDPVGEKIFYFSEWSPRDLVEWSIDINTPSFTRERESFFHNSDGWVSPLRVSENGSFVANGSGRISSVYDLGEYADVLDDEYFTDMAWLHGNLFGLQSVDGNTYSRIQRWNADFTKNSTDVFDVLGAPIGLVALPNHSQLALICQSGGKPRIELFSFTENDFDNDGYADSIDALPADASDYLDNDNDGVGDTADRDDDNDGVNDPLDAFPFDATETLDSDGDGQGNNKDMDDDNDNIMDVEDAFPFDSGESADYDQDGVGNNADPDDDNDGVADIEDVFPFDDLESSDADGDGVGDRADDDDDNDGVNDYADLYPNDATRWQLTGADFYPTASGSNWIFDRSSAALVDPISIAGQRVTPLRFSTTESRLYINGRGNSIDLHGFYLPSVSTGYGTFSTDLKLDRAISLVQTGDLSGTGSVNISPTYGERSMNWDASVVYYGIDYLEVPAGEYYALHSSVWFNAKTSIDGTIVSLLYIVDIWFAEDVGIVQIEEFGRQSKLQSYNIGVSSNTSGNSTGASSDGGSGGGGSTSIWLLFLLMFAQSFRRFNRV